MVFQHNAKQIEERGWDGIQETLTAVYPEGRGRNHSEDKNVWKIHFQSLSNERLYFIYYVAKHTSWFFGAYYLHNHKV